MGVSGGEAARRHLLFALLLLLLLAFIAVIQGSCCGSPASCCTHTDTLRYKAFNRSALLDPMSVFDTVSSVHMSKQLKKGCLLSSVAMAIPAASPWLVNEMGEPLCSMVAPPPYSYDPNGSDLPRGQRPNSSQHIHSYICLTVCVCVCADCRVLQYYFNLGVQVKHSPAAGQGN